MHIAINAAPESKVRGQWGNVGVDGIVDFNSEDVITADIEIGCDVENKCSEPALMFTQKISIKVNVGDTKCAVEFQKEMAVRVAGRRCEMETIPTDACVIVGLGIGLAIGDVPSMWQIDIGPG